MSMDTAFISTIEDEIAHVMRLSPAARAFAG
jgi:hypothetical protein